METISRLLLVFLINAIWQTPAVMLAASLCDRVMRNAPARFRHWLWVIALVICLALPLSSLTGLGQPTAPGSSSSAIAIEEGDASQRSAFANGVNELWRRNFLSIQPAPLALSPALTFAVLSCYLLSLLCHLAKIRRSWLRTNEIRSDAYEREIPAPMARVAARCRSAYGARDIPILSSAALFADRIPPGRGAGEAPGQSNPRVGM